MSLSNFNHSETECVNQLQRHNSSIELLRRTLSNQRIISYSLKSVSAYNTKQEINKMYNPFETEYCVMQNNVIHHCTCSPLLEEKKTSSKPIKRSFLESYVTSRLPCQCSHCVKTRKNRKLQSELTEEDLQQVNKWIEESNGKARCFCPPKFYKEPYETGFWKTLFSSFLLATKAYQTNFLQNMGVKKYLCDCPQCKLERAKESGRLPIEEELKLEEKAYTDKKKNAENKKLMKKKLKAERAEKKALKIKKKAEVKTQKKARQALLRAKKKGIILLEKQLKYVNKKYVCVDCPPVECKIRVGNRHMSSCGCEVNPVVKDPRPFMTFQVNTKAYRKLKFEKTKKVSFKPDVKPRFKLHHTFLDDDHDSNYGQKCTLKLLSMPPADFKCKERHRCSTCRKNELDFNKIINKK